MAGDGRERALRIGRTGMHALLALLPADLHEQALTHPAFVDQRTRSYERLEFLGDSVLSLAITDALMSGHPELSEGELTRVRSIVVSRDSCEVVARAAGLGEGMVAVADTRYAAPAQRIAREYATQRNTLAALCEAVIGAAFQAAGWSAVAPLVVAAFEPRTAWALVNRVDARGELQESADRVGATVTFELVGTEGPPHDRRFTMRVTTGEGPGAWSAASAEGSGRSKQEAQRLAAAALLAIVARAEA